MSSQQSLTPGTVHLVDLQGVLNLKHASGSQKNDIVLVPSPSSDPDDPLNWSSSRKWLATACVCVYTFAIGTTSAAIYSVLEPIEKDTSLTLGDLNAGTGYMFLLFGWGCLFWQPLALQYGKRPVYLMSTLATMAIMIWVPYTQTNGQWIGSKLLQGFFGAPVESLCEISIADIHFTHNRGSYIALYALFLGGSSYAAPIMAGFINIGQGWKWVLYWCAILSAVVFVFLFLFMEETNYHRKPLTVRDHSNSGTASSADTNKSADEKTESFKQSITDTPFAEDGQRFSEIPKKRLFGNKLKIFHREALHYPNRMRGMALRPLLFLSFPIIFYSGLSYGSNLVWFNVLNGTASLILSGEPYNFSSSIVGLCYVSPLIGSILGSLYTGTIGDWLVVRMARQNQGIMEPESRLWLFSLSIILMPAGLILWGVGAAHGIHWFGLVFAMGLIAITNSLGVQISLSYCIDSYRELSGEAVVTVILIRNTMSFAIGYGLTPWVSNMGLQNAFLVAALAGLAQTLLFLIFVRYGRRFRQASEKRYHAYVEEMKAAGLVH